MRSSAWHRAQGRHDDVPLEDVLIEVWSSSELSPSRGAWLRARCLALPALLNSRRLAAWRRIDFISDLHLCAQQPRTFGSLGRLPVGTPADAIFILGDLFEVWIGDDARQPGRFERSAPRCLADAASRRTLGFMAGNRDFLVGAAMLKACGVTALPDPTLLSAWGQRVLLTHGDALCLDDEAYQPSAPGAQRGLAPRFPAATAGRHATQARMMRDASQASQRRQTAADWVDVDAAAAVGWMHAAGSRELVHGHTHRPGSEVLAPGYKRHVLSDWDLRQRAHAGAGAAPDARRLRARRPGAVIAP